MTVTSQQQASSQNSEARKWSVATTSHDATHPVLRKCVGDD